MSDALPDDAWINSFLSAPPKPLQVALQKRLQTSTVHVNSLAELYKQRAAIEAQYAESLSKLSRSAEQGSLLSKTSPDWDKRSIEGRMWESALSELSETSSSHSTLSAIIKTDFEQPLRDLPSKIVSWRRIGDQDASLEKTLKDYEKTSSKLEKASQKSKSGKTDALSNELSQLTSSLSSLSPMVYTTYQRLDEERLRTLKEILVRWGTIRADMSQRDGERAERSVAVLVSLETQDEVLAVGRKLGGSSGDSRSQQSNNAPTLSSTQNTPRSVRRLSNTPSASATDFSPRPTPRQNGSSNTLTSGTPSSFAGGLKSMLGRKSTIGPTTISRNRSGSNAPSTQSGREREGNFSTIGENGENAGTIQNGAPVDEEGFSVAPADRHRNPWEDPDELIPAPAVNTSSTTPATAAGANSMYTDQLASSPSGSSEDLRTSTAPTQPRLNLAMTSAPIEEDEAERQAALNRMQQTLQLQPQAQPTRRGTIARGRRDVRNTMFATSALDSAALSRLSSSPSRSEGGSILNSVTEPTPTLGSSAPSQSEQPTAPAPIARQSSMSSVGSNNPFDSPGLGGPTSAFAPKSVNGPGLRANMTESMNVIMQGEKIQRIQVNGEVHVTLRDMEGHSLSQGPIHIQLTEFERLEKIAPNPAYLAQVPDRPGEYFLNSEVLASATKNAPSTGTLLFRYQVYIPTGKEASLLPLFMEPAFRSTDGETKLIVNYHRNPACQLSASQLSGLSLVVAFGPGPNITNVQAKPAGGVWSPATRRMTWTIGQDELEKGKLIAKLVSVPGGGALTPLGVQASWAIAGELCSGIGLEVISGGGDDWSFEEVKKVITTGKYLSEPAAV